MSDICSTHKLPALDNDDAYHCLQPKHIQMIEEALRSLGDYGEVRLVIEKGHLRFLITQKSYDTLKWYPGSFVRNIEP